MVTIDCSCPDPPRHTEASGTGRNENWQFAKEKSVNWLKTIADKGAGKKPVAIEELLLAPALLDGEILCRTEAL